MPPKGRKPACALVLFLQSALNKCARNGHSGNRPGVLTNESGILCLDALVGAELPLLLPPPSWLLSEASWVALAGSGPENRV